MPSAVLGDGGNTSYLGKYPWVGSHWWMSGARPPGPISTLLTHFIPRGAAGAWGPMPAQSVPALPSEENGS